MFFLAIWERLKMIAHCTDVAQDHVALDSSDGMIIVYRVGI